MKKKTKRMKKKLYCKCCEEVITEDMLDEAWESNEGVFCSEHCIANWYGSNDLYDYEELLKEYGR